MRRDMQLPLAVRPWPAGVTRVPFTTDLAPACRDLMNHVYAEGYGDPQPFDRWWTWTTSQPDWDPALVYLALDGNELVGFCHTWTDNFVKDLVVARPWRKRGLGSALLTTALEVYAGRGARSVDLKTDVDNLIAQSFYRGLGFEIVERLEG